MVTEGSVNGFVVGAKECDWNTIRALILDYILFSQSGHSNWGQLLCGGYS